jgi:iron-only hydrogenase group A
MLIEVNNKKVEAKQTETLLTAIKRAGVKIPSLCHIEGLGSSNSCRLCIVEIEGNPDLVTSCDYRAVEGLKIKTHSPKVVQARRIIIDLLLANHPDDCLYCIRNQECVLQTLAKENGITDRLFTTAKTDFCIDNSSPAIVFESSKCILCGKCVRVCNEIQGISTLCFKKNGSHTSVGVATNEPLNKSNCVYCGQCIMYCPTSSLRERDNIEKTISAIEDKNIYTIAFHGPDVTFSLGEEFNLKPGTDINRNITAALKNMGFDKVFDTSFASDIAIIEQAKELVEHIQYSNTFPLFSSSCPSLIKFVEQYYPEFIPNLSNCKSPRQIMGGIIKSYFAGLKGLDPSKIINISANSCIASKFEAARSEHTENVVPSIDISLTTREIARMIKMRGIDLNSLGPIIPDNPFNENSSAAKLIATSGGLLEGILRTVNYLMTGEILEQPPLQDIRGFDGIKESKLKINEFEIKVAAVSGLRNVRRLLDDIKKGRKELHYIEMSACSGGCIAGAGQPKPYNSENIKARVKSLYNIDKINTLRNAHNNKSVTRFYEEFLEKMPDEKRFSLLHKKLHRSGLFVEK